MEFSSGPVIPQRRHLPKLVACMTKISLENARNKALYGMELLDAKGIRRRKMPLHECLILELREAGYSESSNYIQDLLYDNSLLVAEDDIGIIVDLRQRADYLEHICAALQKAEKEREKEQTKKESMTLLKLAQEYADKGKGILWLAEKFFLACIAVASQYLTDGGRLKGCCKYFYAKFLLDKFPMADPDEAFLILTEVRDAAIGKSWPLYEAEKEGSEVPSETLFCAIAVQLHRVLLQKARMILRCDPAKAERLSRLAERRAKDAEDHTLLGEAVIQVGICQLKMNNLNNAQKTFNRAMGINTEINNVKGLCETKMHLAAVMQRLNEFETAARLLTEMGLLAMENGLRWQLGRALHLLGELHLRRERPELGTQHLAEAFSCFMGFGWAGLDTALSQNFSTREAKSFQIVYKEKNPEMFVEEAEQSRLMMAISAGQELKATYFNLINQSWDCQVARVQVIEWKLYKAGWWLKRPHLDLIPCLCKLHERTALDVMWVALERRNQAMAAEEAAESGFFPWLERDYTIQDIQKLQSSNLMRMKEAGESTEQLEAKRKGKRGATTKAAEKIEEEKVGGDKKDEKIPDDKTPKEEKTLDEKI